MPKLKTNKSARKRLKLTKKGLLKRWKSGRRHILTSKSANRKRGLRQEATLQGMEAKTLRKLLPYG
ncbi:MAG: 50S ribosomal protein L35 [Candidatus Omnitrophota bacterium]